MIEHDRAQTAMAREIREIPSALAIVLGNAAQCFRGCKSLPGARCCLGLGSQHRVVRVAEDKYLRSAPNDPFQLHECAHLQAILPQHQVLNEVPREAPGPEWQSPIADRVEAESAHLVDEEIGADKIVAPVVEERGDAEVILFTPTMIQ